MQADGSQGEARFVNAVAVVVGQALGSGLDALVLDDLHFADETSLEVIEHLALPGRLRVLLAFRDVELSEAGKRLVEAVTPAADGRRVPLSPLSRGDVRAFVASLDVEGLDPDVYANALHRKCGGNPLFLLETIKAMLAQASGGSLVAASIDQLPAASSVGALIEKRVSRSSATRPTRR